MPSYCYVETVTAGFIRQRWNTPDADQADSIARKLSVAAINNPTYPNPFHVVEANGTLRRKYLEGTAHSID